QKIKVLLDVAGENELKPLVKDYLIEAFHRTENINAVLEIEEGVSYVISVVLVEARVGENRQKTGNIAACIQYISYFDDSILKPDVAVSNWERVNNLTTNLIEHSQTGLHLFPKDDLEKMTGSVVSKFQELLLEKHE
ncbi:hypothetical protein C6503_15210, partial [Candidatus Poribacteria bacterium]